LSRHEADECNRDVDPELGHDNRADDVYGDEHGRVDVGGDSRDLDRLCADAGWITRSRSDERHHDYDHDRRGHFDDHTFRRGFHRTAGPNRADVQHSG